ncbi:MAG TPA: hypothetical protein VE861_14475, partial [Gemmatimonadaceae bacterium]|nr:hypothetical protein [Gemmatimonadaceae bacterium]
MTDVSNALDAVSVLIGERTKYEGWISALSAKTDVPAHVLEKVRADYTSRLRSVLQAFTAHTPALDASLSELQARDGSLMAQEKSCRDEHAEGELRHMVGEYDGEQWDKVRIGHEALLARLASERQGIASELSSVQRSLAAAADAAQRARSIGEMTPTSVPARLDSATPTPSSPTPSIAGGGFEPAAPPPSVTMPEPDVLVPAIGYRPTPTPASSMPEVAGRRTPTDAELGFLRTTQRTPVTTGGMEQERQQQGGATATRPAEPALRI